jgi:protein-S-isoprenylcysteine O-methyltransferase Ste14
VALGVAVLGMAFSTWAMLENRFFSAVVRIQRDRNQTVVSTGPYRLVRHPGYAGGVVTYLATPFVLDAMWGWIPAALVILGVFIRTWLEDRTLQEELDGYKDYTQDVHHRLVPGIW